MARNCWAVLTAAGSCGLVVPGPRKEGSAKKGQGGCVPGNKEAAGLQGAVWARHSVQPGPRPTQGPSATRAGEAAAIWALQWFLVCVRPGDARQPPRVAYSLCVAVTERISANSRSYSETGAG